MTKLKGGDQKNDYFQNLGKTLKSGLHVTYFPIKNSGERNKNAVNGIITNLNLSADPRYVTIKRTNSNIIDEIKGDENVPHSEIIPVKNIPLANITPVNFEIGNEVRWTGDHGSRTNRKFKGVVEGIVENNNTHLKIKNYDLNNNKEPRINSNFREKYPILKITKTKLRKIKHNENNYNNLHNYIENHNRQSEYLPLNWRNNSDYDLIRNSKENLENTSIGKPVAYSTSSGKRAVGIISGRNNTREYINHNGEVAGKKPAVKISPKPSEQKETKQHNTYLKSNNNYKQKCVREISENNYTEFTNNNRKLTNICPNPNKSQNNSPTTTGSQKDPSNIELLNSNDRSLNRNNSNNIQNITKTPTKTPTINRYLKNYEGRVIGLQKTRGSVAETTEKKFRKHIKIIGSKNNNNGKKG
jgi:hypothetical protein